MTFAQNHKTAGTPSGNQLAISNTPPPSVTMPFFAASFLGLIGCGIALTIAAPTAITDPTSDPTVAAAHLMMLATLSMGVLGAIHQFTPVVTQRKIRSVTAARATFISWLLAAWLLPLGIGTGHPMVVEVGGGLAAIAIALLVANLWIPLSVKGKGTPVVGLRLSILGFVATACFGVVYVADRSGNWFVLSGHTVLAHAVIGIFAWLGLTYVSVSEKLWPMFFLAHIPGKHSSGKIAIYLIPVGILLLSPGLLLQVPILSWAGALIVTTGLVFHLNSFLTHVRNSKRKADLYQVQVATAEIWLIVGIGFALYSSLEMQTDYRFAIMLASASITSFAGWILGAFVGHAHKVIPFTLWSMFRKRGITENLAGHQLMFTDLYNHSLALATFVLVNLAIAATCIALVIASKVVMTGAGAAFALIGVILAVNFATKPISIARRASKPI